MTPSLLRPPLIIVALLCGLGGCGGRSYHSDVPEPEAPVAVLPETPARAVRAGYTVRRGDTLYSIAFSVGKDWREVAALNGIQAPYTIYPGQVLQLGVPVAPGPVEPLTSAAVASSARAQPAPDSGAITAAVNTAQPAPAATTRAGTPMEAMPERSQPAADQQAQEIAVAHDPPATRAVMPVEPRPAAPMPGAWQWPAAGKLIQRFSTGAQPHKGVDLDGRSGDAVYAANSGSVVYAGNGVRGYGNLLIVKHDETFLSAYAHNSKLLVKEGDVVRGGEKIAEIGDSGTDRVKLHFEVRKQGNPVDPLKILPRR